MAALAEFERALIVERTNAGLRSAQALGVRLGRPRALTPAQVRHARTLLEAGERAVSVAVSLGVSRATLYRALRAAGKVAPANYGRLKAQGAS